MELLINNDIELMEFANSLGKPVSSRINSPLIDNLTPLNKEDAHSQSLSSHFGSENFPFHTDGAYFNIPPRYIILRYIKGVENPTPTLICNLSDIDENAKILLKNSIWKVKSRGTSFYSTILSENSSFYRYDPCVMNPVNVKDLIYFENLIVSLPKQTINWESNKTVVIDNWKSVHARPKVKVEEIKFRTLQRIMVI